MKKVRVSLFVKLICMVVIPLIFLGVSLILLGRNGIRSTVSNEIINQLENTLRDTEIALDVFDEGDYSVRNKVFFKGKSDIAYMNDYIRTVKENTDIDITIFVADTRYLTTIKSDNGNLALGTKADADVCQAVLEKGETYESDHVSVNGEKFFGVYIPLKDSSQKVIGMLFAGSPVSYVNRIVSREAGTMTIMSVMMIVIILASSFFVTYRIAGKLKNSIRYVFSLSEGDFEFQLNDRDCSRRDEIGGLALGIRNLRDTLKDMVAGIMHSSDSLYTGSEDLREMNGNYVQATDQITKIIGELRQSIVSMAESIQICNGVTGDMGNQIDDIMRDMVELENTTLSAAQTTENSLGMIELLKKTNEAAVKTSENIETHVYMTDEYVRNISEATKVLGEITSRINLLSLNASIEAARAGESGKGFAVVADEIGKLSKQSEESTKDIIEITRDLLQASANTTRDAKSMREAVAQEKTALDDTGDVFRKMLDNMQTVEKLVMNSIDKAGKMHGLKNKVIDNMCDLSTISEENAAIAENVNDECQKIARESEGLTDKSENIRVLAFNLEEKLRFFKCSS